MSKGLATRTAILDEAMKQASLVGLEGLSLAPLAERLHLSKSGLFAHFRSKEALQIEVLQTAITRFKTDVIAPSSRAKTVEDRLVQLFTRWLNWVRSGAESGGCLFMTVAQEFDSRPGPVRDLLVASQKDMRTYVAGLLKEGVENGTFSNGTDPEQWVFEFCGMALSFQYAANLLDDPKAKKRALGGLHRLLGSIKVVQP